MLESDTIEVLELAVAQLPGAVRLTELRVPAEDQVPAAVELEVDGLAAEMRRELRVLRLALLPAGGHERDRPRHAERRRGLSDVRIAALRPEEREPHRART